ncbi:MAG: M56 family metallopeptidase [Acidimicrobiales bacterium]|nr:M56 family metallopeptidase [Acidimicrobiales bacterium]
MTLIGSLATVAVLIAVGLRRHLPPKPTVRLLVASMTAAGLITVWILAAAALQGVAALPWLREHLAWCSGAYPLDHEVHPAASAIALMALGLVVRTLAVRIPTSSLRLGPSADVGPLRLVHCNEPVAFAEPGAPGRVVVSTGALAALDEPERRALFAHEHAHLRNAHHRLLLLAQASAIALPLLYPLVRVVRYLLERWADEDAAVEIGSRTVLASAMARFALSSPAVSPALGFASLGVVGRVRELVEPPTHRRWKVIAARGAFVVILASASLVAMGRMESVLRLLAHLCGTG